MKKIILDLCGGTGSWSRPYKASSEYEVLNITLPECDVRRYEPPKNVYGILAAPPCTEFSLAKTTAARNFEIGLEIVVACLKIIWKSRIKNRIKFWALENPTGILRQFLGLPAMTFQPYEYGNFYTKKTDVWGYFNIPKKKPLSGFMNQFINNNYIGNIAGWDKEKQKELRSKTPAGFAQSFFKANR
jgi:site-specific DNA-cytosine methylase